MNTLKEYFQAVMFDKKGRFCSPKTSLAFHKENSEATSLLRKNLEEGISIPETIYRVLKDIKDCPKCEFCEQKASYVSFREGFSKTCGNEICKRKGYGKNPHILSDDERKAQSERMKRNNPMFDKNICARALATQRKNGKGHLPFNSLEALEKSLASRYDKYKSFSPKNKLFKPKPYILPSGQTRMIQGYENKALDELLKIYPESEIVLCGKSHPFKYRMKNKTRRYYPDIFIPSKNLYIEVKSDYTYKIDLDRNLKKKQAIIQSGFLFQFWIINAKNQITIL